MTESVVLSSVAVAVLARAKDAWAAPSLEYGEWIAATTRAEDEAADDLAGAGFLDCQFRDDLNVMLFRITDKGLLVWLIQAGARRGVTK